MNFIFKDFIFFFKKNCFKSLILPLNVIFLQNCAILFTFKNKHPKKPKAAKKHNNPFAYILLWHFFLAICPKTNLLLFKLPFSLIFPKISNKCSKYKRFLKESLKS